MSEKLYLFKGDQYIQCDVASRKVDDGYPRQIGNDWAGLSHYNWSANGHDVPVFLLDRNIVASPSKDQFVWFYLRNEGYLWCIQYDLTEDTAGYMNNASLEYGRIASQNFVNNISAARYLDDDLYLFSGNQWMLQKSGINVLENELFQNTDTMPHLPAGYTDNFDAVVELEGKNTMFFKGGDCFVYSTEPEPQPISSIWIGTDKIGFDRDIDAACVLPAEKSSYVKSNT